MILNTFLVVLIGIFPNLLWAYSRGNDRTARLDRYCVEDQEDLKESLIQALAVEKYNFTKWRLRWVWTNRTGTMMR